jgi:hypothetical protein
MSTARRLFMEKSSSYVDDSRWVVVLLLLSGERVKGW